MSMAKLSYDSELVQRSEVFVLLCATKVQMFTEARERSGRRRVETKQGQDVGEGEGKRVCEGLKGQTPGLCEMSSAEVS